VSTLPDRLAQGLPDLTGQPGWVYIVVVALTTFGTLGLAWIKRGERARAAEDPTTPRPVDAKAVPSLPGATPPDATLVIQGALEHLAHVAEREALESREARSETADLRRELLVCGTELTTALRRAEAAEAELVRCRVQAELLSRQAFRKGPDHDHG
jgi:uncharacterized membrane protein